MLFLDQKSILAMINLNEIIDNIEGCLIDSEKPDDFVMPLRTSVADADNNILMLMPCLAKHVWGLKTLTLFSQNPSKGRPYIDGIVTLYSPDTGEALAMMDGKIITALRTGAIGGVGIRHLSKPGLSTLGLFGAGIQGYWQVRYACTARDIKDVWVYEMFEGKLPTFLSQLRAALPEVNFHIAASPAELLENVEAVMTATTSLNPVLPDSAELLKNHCFVGIGSYRPDMREYPDSLFSVLDEVYVDTAHALDETGDLLTPIANGLLKKESVKTIGSRLVSGTSGNAPSTVLYKAVGGALFDLYAADHIYRQAKAKGIGTELDLS